MYSLNRKKKSIKMMEDEDAYFKEEQLNLKIFKPKEMIRSLDTFDFQKFVKFLKLQNDLRTIITEKEKIFILKDDKMTNIKKATLDEFIKNSCNRMNCVLNNPAKYISKRAKVNIESLFKICKNLKTCDRSINQIKKLYNDQHPNSKLSVTSIRNHIHDSLKFKYQTVDYRTKSYFTQQADLSQLTFIYRLIMDMLDLKNIVYFDESGIDSTKRQRKSWFHLSEKKQSQKPKRFRRINILMAINNRKVDFYKLSKKNTNGIAINDFFTEYVKNKGAETCKNTTVVLDNATYHCDKKYVNGISNSFCRLLFIPPGMPNMNAIEFLFGKLKKRLQLKDLSNM